MLIQLNVSRFSIDPFGGCGTQVPRNGSAVPSGMRRGIWRRRGSPATSSGRF